MPDREFRWVGRYYPGAMRDHREALRREAEDRDDVTPWERTAEYRREQASEAHGGSDA